MSPLDFIAIILVVYGLVVGYHRGLIVTLLEYAQMALAMLVAVAVFRPLGNALHTPMGASIEIAQLAALIGVFLVAAIGAIILTAWLMHRFSGRLRLYPPGLASRLAGAVVNGVKLLALAAVVVVLTQALPLSGTDQRSLFSSPLTKSLLSTQDPVAVIMHDVLGDTLKHGLGLLTVTTEAEDDKLIQLGFTTTGQVDSADESKMLDLLNAERSKQGLGALTANLQAQKVARTYATDLFARGYFSHVSLEGKTPFDRLTAAGIPFGFAGENLALAPDLQAAHAGLMNSPPHRANILSPHYRTVGIGIIKSVDHGIMAVQDFTD